MFIIYRTSVEPEALPCFEVPRHVGGRTSDGQNKERPMGPYPSLGYNLDLIFRGCVFPQLKTSSTSEDPGRSVLSSCA